MGRRVLWTTLVLLAGLAGSGAAEAQVLLTLSSPTARRDALIRLQVGLAGGGELQAVAFDLVFDPQRLAVADGDGDASNGLQPDVAVARGLQEPGVPGLFAVAAPLDEPGRLVVGLARAGADPALSDPAPRVLLTVGLRAVALTTATVRFENVRLYGPLGLAPAPVTTSEARVTVVESAANRAPVVSLPGSIAARPGNVRLDASEASDPDGDALSYRWSVVSGSGVALTRTTGAATVAELQAGGSARVRLEVSDATATSTRELELTASPEVDTAPHIAPAAVGAQALAGFVDLPFRLDDLEGDAALALVEVAESPTATFRAATAAPGSLAGGTLDAPPGGRRHLFVWNSLADLPGLRRPSVVLRFTALPAAGGAAGPAAMLGPLVVDNGAAAPVVRLLEPRAGARVPLGVPVVLRGEALDGGGARLTGDALRHSSLPGSTLGSGESVTATFDVPGPRVLVLTATDSSARTATASVTVFVTALSSTVHRLTLTGRVAGPAVATGARVLFRNDSRGASASGRIGEDSRFEAVLASAEEPVAAAGDALACEMVESLGASRVLTPATIRLEAADLQLGYREQDFTALEASPPVTLSAGLNLIGLPRDPRSGQSPYTSRHLRDDASADWVARTTQGRFELFLEPTLTPAWTIAGNEGLMVHVPAERTLVVTGTVWPPSARDRELVRGLNLVAFPFGVPAAFTGRSLLSGTGSQFLVDFEREGSAASPRARLFHLLSDRPAPPIRAGRGYLVRAPTARRMRLPAASEP